MVDPAIKCWRFECNSLIITACSACRDSGIRFGIRDAPLMELHADSIIRPPRTRTAPTRARSNSDSNARLFAIRRAATFFATDN